MIHRAVTLCLLLFSVVLLPGTPGCVDYEDGVALREKAVDAVGRSMELNVLRLQPRTSISNRDEFLQGRAWPQLDLGMDVDLALINRGPFTLRVDSLRLELLTHRLSDLGPMPERAVATGRVMHPVRSRPGDTTRFTARLRVHGGPAAEDLLGQLSGGQYGYRVLAAGVLKGEKTRVPISLELDRGMTPEWSWR